VSSCITIELLLFILLLMLLLLHASQVKSLVLINFPLFTHSRSLAHFGECAVSALRRKFAVLSREQQQQQQE
jgi:hypothetical protein